MAKKKVKAENLPEETGADEPVDLFIGGEDDDLMDMQYIQDENTTTKIETMPPETKEEAEVAAEFEVDDPTPVEEEVASDEESTEEAEAEEAEPEAEETVLEAEPEEDPRIPKERFDEVNERMKRAEEKLRELEAQQQVQPEPEPEPEPEPYDYASKDAEAMDALLEGDSARYSEIQNEIREATRDEALREARKLAQSEGQQVRETLTFEEAAAKIESDYPQFAQGNENFNRAAYDELLDLYLGYAQSGRYSRVDAMRRAAEKAVKIFDFDKSADPEPAPDPDNVVALKQPNVAEKAKVAKQQPPKMQGGIAGDVEPKVDLTSMSDEEFGALPESTKRRMRGDIL